MEKDKLMMLFEDAKKHKYKFLGVKIETKGHPGAEIIINPLANYDVKKDYYDKAYDDNLVLKTFDGIRIVDAMTGNSFENIEYWLTD
ncbi:MAG: hypothetical protein ACRC3H_24395 [Lachnospiraceae bacterium]